MDKNEYWARRFLIGIFLFGCLSVCLFYSVYRWEVVREGHTPKELLRMIFSEDVLLLATLEELNLAFFALLVTVICIVCYMRYNSYVRKIKRIIAEGRRTDGIIRKAEYSFYRGRVPFIGNDKYYLYIEFNQLRKSPLLLKRGC